MITTAFIDLAYYLIAQLILFLPGGGGFPTGVHTAAAYFGGYVGVLNQLFPVDTLLTVVTLIFTIEIGLWGFRSIRWILTHVPFIGGD